MLILPNLDVYIYIHTHNMLPRSGTRACRVSNSMACVCLDCIIYMFQSGRTKHNTRKVNT